MAASGGFWRCALTLQSVVVELLGMAALAGGMSHKETSVGNCRLTHERIAQPLLPDHFAGFFIHHNQCAALGVEGHISGFNYGGSRAIIRGLDFPYQVASLGIEGVELMRTISAAYEDHAIGEGMGCNRTSAGNAHHPSGSPIGGLESLGLKVAGDLGQRHIRSVIEGDFNPFRWRGVA